MINIRIDKELTAYMSSKKLRLDELFAVICFNLDKLDLLKSALGNKTPDQLTAYFQTYERKMLLKKLMPELADFDWDNYEITESAKKIYEEASVFLVDATGEVVIPDLTPESIIEAEDEGVFDKFVLSFIELFPEGVRNRGGDYLRSNKKDVFRKMVGFMKRYTYDVTTVLGATKHYLNQQAIQGYAYCNAAHYFVMKDNISKLATECEAFKSSGGKNMDDTSWTQTM